MSVFALASSVAGFVKVRYLEDKAVVDDRIFRLHYRITSAVLFLSCLLVTANELIGSPIQCIVGGTSSDDEAKAITTYCWITNTFTMPDLYHSKVGSEVISSGIGNDNAGEHKYHSYYQWVPFVLFFQGVLFYLPHWMWKNWEEGRMKKLTEGLRGAQIGTKEARLEQQTKVVQYFVESLHMHNVYAIGYFFCQALNFINVIANMFLINKFLGGTFFTYGLDVLSFVGVDQSQRTDPMITVFPRLTKCIFQKFGPSGSPQKMDALCVLALNVINEKIYIFLWFWLILLAVLSALSVAHSVAICLSPTMREKILKGRFSSKTSAGMSALVRNTRVGDFLLLHLMGKNLNTRVYCDLLDEISCRLHLDDGTVTTPSTLKLQPLYPSDKLRLHQEDEINKSV